MKSKYDYPPRKRQLMIKSWFAILFLIIGLIYLYGCSPRLGGKATRNLSGYGWIKCNETGKVFILSKDGTIVYSYQEKAH